MSFCAMSRQNRPVFHQESKAEPIFPIRLIGLLLLAEERFIHLVNSLNL
jgi:hypothetical protein